MCHPISYLQRQGGKIQQEHDDEMQMGKPKKGYFRVHYCAVSWCRCGNLDYTCQFKFLKKKKQLLRTRVKGRRGAGLRMERRAKDGESEKEEEEEGGKVERDV
ncbi:hypothetical protein EYF80_060144 [Liparis tanakae]|uniref:Uncharacterized protein n=1 Tax=Liparis tanakae TaxID=230148 RepID=A0A4Z2EL71_9TELE|nr:hypothetical protein EYF80_060144 [Liparis tanakae]